MALALGVIEETLPGETRVAMIPEVAAKFAALGVKILIQQGAGDKAGIPDNEYSDHCTLLATAEEVLAQCDVLLAVQPPSVEVAAALEKGKVLIGFLAPFREKELLQTLRDKSLTAFAMELIPRISRAQSMDALSSQAAVAGYKAVLIAANTLDKFFPMLTTAAGTIRPAKVLVIGAGVAGLQALATARRLGAVVEGYDVRSATREQIESLGARFVDTGVSAEGEGGYARELTEDEKKTQQEVLEKHIALADVVITTAAIPGRPAPRIISAAAVANMKPGAVIVDLSAETGGNCELTKAGETVEHDGVRIVGPVNLAADLANHASEMYARNLFNFLSPAISDGELSIDWEDEVFAGALLTRDGEVIHGPSREQLADPSTQGNRQ
ncbi:MAG: Re/Si-specific NAD(P)(+) transhydrogenase subunit alpha [Gammaproteobacteria bacterium]